MNKEKTVVTLPKLSPNMKNATLVAWNKDINDEVRKGDVIFEIETDKVICEIESTKDGMLEEICFKEGDRINVGEAVAVIV